MFHTYLVSNCQQFYCQGASASSFQLHIYCYIDALLILAFRINQVQRISAMEASLMLKLENAFRKAPDDKSLVWVPLEHFAEVDEVASFEILLSTTVKVEVLELPEFFEVMLLQFLFDETKFQQLEDF